MLNGSLLYLLSPDLLREYRDLLLRPEPSRLHGLTEAEIEPFLTEITANAIWREPDPDTGHPSPVPKDAHLWSLTGTRAGRCAHHRGSPAHRKPKTPKFSHVTGYLG